MVGYELAVNTVAAAAGAAYAEFQPNTARRSKMREIGFFAQAATATGKTQLGRPGNSPTGGAVQIANALDPADIASVNGWNTTWTVAPTAPAAADVKRQFDGAAAIGAGPIWVWDSDRALVVGPARTQANGLVLWNASAAGGPILSLYGCWFE